MQEFKSKIDILLPVFKIFEIIFQKFYAVLYSTPLLEAFEKICSLTDLLNQNDFNVEELEQIKAEIKFRIENSKKTKTEQKEQPPKKKGSTPKEIARWRADLGAQDFPGILSTSGARHNNDFDEISKISVIPTLEEILCPRTPVINKTNLF